MESHLDAIEQEIAEAESPRYPQDPFTGALRPYWESHDE